MPESQIQAIKDVFKMTPRLSIEFLNHIKNEMENEINSILLKLDDGVILENMDITEKILLLDFLTESKKTKDEESKNSESLEEILKREGLTFIDSQN